MQWLYCADEAIASILINHYINLDELFQNTEERVTLPNMLMQQCFETLKDTIKVVVTDLSNQLTRKTGISKPFYLANIIHHIETAIANLNSSIFHKQSFWLIIGGKMQVATSLNELAREVYKSQDELYKRKLVGSSDDTRFTYSRIVYGLEHLKKLYDFGCIFSASGVVLKGFKHVQAAFEDRRLMISSNLTSGFLLVENVEPWQIQELIKDPKRKQLWKNTGGKLSPYKVEVNLAAAAIDLKDGKQTSLARIFKASLKNHLISPVAFANLYRQSLSLSNTWPDRDSYSKARERLRNRQLADHDIDLLLSLAHIMTSGASDKSGTLARPDYYRSIFIDEVQDFTEQQVFLMAQLADPEFQAITVVGDMQQKLNKDGVNNLQSCFPYHAKVPTVLLKENKRQEHSPELEALTRVFRHSVQKDKRLDVTLTDHQLIQQAIQNKKNYQVLDCQDAQQHLDQVFRAIESQPKGRTVAVILPTVELAKNYEENLRDRLRTTFRHSYVSDNVDLAKKYLVHFTCPKHVKGLEFDTVILPELDKYDWSQLEILNSIYVSLSRPRKQLYVFGDLKALPSEVRSTLY